MVKGNVPYGTITTISESPVKEGVIYVEVMMDLFMLQKMQEKHGIIFQIAYPKICGLAIYMLRIMMKKLSTPL